tara:strand:+ start:1091 stop:1804 length:714 start_codon:yes stop_codon:yes gene_type:complete
MDITKVTTLVQALLNIAQEQGFNGLTITSLTKLIYLADVYYARKNNGETYSGTEWKFHHFGPYSYQLSEYIENKIPNVRVETGETHNQGHSFKLIKLSDYSKTSTMQDTQLGIGITSTLQSNVKSFSGSLNSLLEYVYFHTEPMKGATPGDKLDFTKCEVINIKDFQKPASKNKTSDKVKEGKRLLASLKAKKDKKKSILGDYTPPKYDDHYNQSHILFDKTEDKISDHIANLTFET